MPAYCPNNLRHDQFETVAHVMQSWKVDREGEHIDTLDDSLQTSFKPDPGNTWTCLHCDTEASHVDDFDALVGERATTILDTLYASEDYDLETADLDNLIVRTDNGKRYYRFSDDGQSLLLIDAR